MLFHESLEWLEQRLPMQLSLSCHADIESSMKGPRHLGISFLLKFFALWSSLSGWNEFKIQHMCHTVLDLEGELEMTVTSRDLFLTTTTLMISPWAEKHSWKWESEDKQIMTIKKSSDGRLNYNLEWWSTAEGIDSKFLVDTDKV